jgi:hypothetical protein
MIEFFCWGLITSDVACFLLFLVRSFGFEFHECFQLECDGDDLRARWDQVEGLEKPIEDFWMETVKSCLDNRLS